MQMFNLDYKYIFHNKAYIFGLKKIKLDTISDGEYKQEIRGFDCILNKKISAEVILKLKKSPTHKMEPIANNKKIAIIGTMGVPGGYGGFETTAENLVNFHTRNAHDSKLTVWCSKKDFVEFPDCFGSANLSYVSLHANGYQSILYDMISLWQAIRSGHDSILLLGTSGALALPLIRLLSRARIYTNIGGIEWRREKWGIVARVMLRASEWAAVRFSHKVISDNQAISNHISETYGGNCSLIPYGGDHALHSIKAYKLSNDLPERFALALCRIEPENNIHLILQAFEGHEIPLVFVGNWDKSIYGKELKVRYANSSNLHLLDSVYDPSILFALRSRAFVYIHGHSVGGTNPSLVEMMHFGIPVLAYDCVFNRFSTEYKALYFDGSAKLEELLNDLDPNEAYRLGAVMLEIAQRRYNWDDVGKAYFEILNSDQSSTRGFRINFDKTNVSN